VNQQGPFADKKREGRCYGVYFGKCLYEENLRLDRNVADKMWNIADKMRFEYLYGIVVEWFSL